MTHDNTPSRRGEWDQSLLVELRRLASIAMANERVDHTLQPTALVNEAYVILQRQRNVDASERASFLAAAATTIRRILVDHARRRDAAKRGGANAQRIPLHVSIPTDANDIDVLAIHDALESLARLSERAAQVVEMKFFGGMTGAEVAEQLGISLRTVNNDWDFAKAWLYRELGSWQSERS